MSNVFNNSQQAVTPSSGSDHPSLTPLSKTGLSDDLQVRPTISDVVSFFV